MHSSGALRSDMFRIELDGRPVASFADLCPGFTAQDRLGVIVQQPLEAVRSSSLILAAVTAFYDAQRKLGSDFFIYPDYYIFHVGCEPGDYSMFDIWPEHKCVRIDGDAEAVLRAVNDRAISLLVLSEREPQEAQLQRHTRNSALARIRQVFLGPVQTEEPAERVRIWGNAVVERYIRQVIDQTSVAPQAEREALRSEQCGAVPNGRAVERYRRVSPEEALRHL